MMRNKNLPATVTLPVQRLELKGSGDRVVFLAPVRGYEAERPNQWAMRELEEVNNWARLGAKIYFCWFVLVLAFNALGMSWLFTRGGVIPDYANVIFVVFLILNLASLFVILRTRSYMLASGERMANVLKEVTRQNGGGLDVQSPMPLVAVSAAFIFSIATLAMLILFWVYLMGWGMAAIYRSAGRPPAAAVSPAATSPAPTAAAPASGQ